MIKKREDVRIKHLNNSKVFAEYSQRMDNVYEDMNEYYLIRKRKKLMVFNDMIVNIITNKKFQIVIEDKFIRCRKLNMFLILIPQSSFSVPKEIRLKSD